MLNQCSPCKLIQLHGHCGNTTPLFRCCTLLSALVLKQWWKCWYKGGKSRYNLLSQCTLHTTTVPASVTICTKLLTSRKGIRDAQVIQGSSQQSRRDQNKLIKCFNKMWWEWCQPLKRFVVARWWAFRPELKLRRHCLCSQSKQARWLKALVMFMHPLRWINKLMGRGAQRAKRFACSHVGMPTHLFVIYSSIYIYFFILYPKLHHLHQAIRWEYCAYSFLGGWLGRLWFSCHCSRQLKKNSNPRKQKQNLMHKQKYAKLAKITTRMRLFVVQTAIHIMG